LDEQIKIRGYRIEPNEIVTALAAHPMVQASIVVARDGIPGDKRLIAYVVSKPGARLTDRELREFLSSYVPEYMVPSVFVKLESLPLNANGKIDRASLPSPDDSNCFPFDPYIAPRSPIEQRIAAILAALLGVERVGVLDNFFMLGGHSLLGTQVIARMRDAFGVELSLRSLFQSPTVAALSEEVERLLYQRVEAMTDEEAEQYLKIQQKTASESV
jgi:acyl carrier protein